MNLVESMRNLGLNEREAKVYLALLQQGKTTAYVVAKVSGLKKSTTYGLLEKLTDKGFVYRVPRTRKMLFKAEAPNKCIALSQEKLNTTKKMLPELEAIKKGRKAKVSVSYFEGIGGIKRMYKKMMKEIEGKEAIGFLGHEKDAPPALKEYWKELHSERVRTKTRGRAIVPRHTTTKRWLKDQKKFFFNLRSVPLKDYDSNVSIEIFKRYVHIISFRHLQGVVIENPDIAKAMKQIFEMNWKAVEEKKK